MCGQKQQKKQPTAKAHVEICLRFKIRVFLLSSCIDGTTLSSSHFDLAVVTIAIIKVFQFEYINKNRKDKTITNMKISTIGSE
jgi:hypothetical protein